MWDARHWSSEVDVNTLADTLGGAEGKKFFTRISNTLAELHPKTPGEILGNVEANTQGDTPGDVNAKVKTETISTHLAIWKPRHLVDMLSYRLTHVEAETLFDSDRCGYRGTGRHTG